MKAYETLLNRLSENDELRKMRAAADTFAELFPDQKMECFKHLLGGKLYTDEIDEDSDDDLSGLADDAGFDLLASKLYEDSGKTAPKAAPQSEGDTKAEAESGEESEDESDAPLPEKATVRVVVVHVNK